MNKKIITGLTVLMGISILGIITVQLIWMNHAIRVKNELFDRSVIEAMQLTASRFEKKRDMSVITQISINDSLKTKSIDSIPAPSQIIKFTNNSNKADNKSNVTTMVVHSDRNGNITWNTTTQIDSNLRKNSFEFKSEKFDSIISSGVLKIDSMVTSLDSIRLNMHNIKKKVFYKANHLKNVANQVVAEIITSEKALPKTDEISSMLAEKLAEKNIPIDFEMGIIQDSIIENKTEKADSTLLFQSPYRAVMFPNDILERNLSFAVYFPEKGKFIYQTINWLLIISMLLSLMVLLTFSTGIFLLLKQKKISEMKTDFINNMTHEFKTPIATISVAADSVLNEKVLTDPEKIKYFAGMIKKENSRMNQQVEDILTIARLDKKDFDFNWELVNIHDLIDEAVQCIQLQVETKKGQITTAYHAQNPIVTCDKKHCLNILYNLLDNAIKYTISAPTISIETKNTTNGVLFSVQDNGIGMSKAVQNKIFEKFYRQTSGNIHNVKGFGLGLSYVKAVTEANKGNVSVKSEQGKGSRFEVFIPFVRE